MFNIIALLYKLTHSGSEFCKNVTVKFRHLQFLQCCKLQKKSLQ